MKFIADFHIHSHFSIATSKKLIPEYLHKWAQIKGINVVGTGDFTHPGWLKELKEKIEPAEPGLFRLKKELLDLDEINVPINLKNDVRFILTSEISSIYKKNDRVRKVHNLIFAPDFKSVEKIQNKLEKIGNIRSDGRPILGLDSKNLLDIILNINENCFLIPAHIWTPWFSALGSKSGFDTIDECYEELTKYIFAIETGLSSDPPMNWICSFLDKFSIISNSDAHSPENLGREANFFNTGLSYFSIRDAMKYKEKNEFLGTVEFFPQEGKYHFDGHRKCGILFDPVESVKNNNLCPICGKKLTLGVLHRVAELADRENFDDRKIKRKFNSLIPLKEILSEIYGVGKKSKRVHSAYLNLLNKLGSEFDILLNRSYDDLSIENDLLAEGITRMREGRVYIKEGYDGEYGIVKVFKDEEKNELGGKNLFCFDNNMTVLNKNSSSYPEIDMKKFKALKNKINEEILFTKEEKKNISGELNDSQLKAAGYLAGPSLIIAGPGTGKTRTLIYKIAEILKKGAEPGSILNLTFSNFAAEEINKRVEKIINKKTIPDNLKAFTFHSFGLSIIEENLDFVGRKTGYHIISKKDKEKILKDILNIKSSDVNKIIKKITGIKEKIIPYDEIDNTELRDIYLKYSKELIHNNLFDFDDLLYLPIYIFLKKPVVLEKYRTKYEYINVDEYQDINFSQYKLLRMIADKIGSKITVIGDPNQAIYGFRGASRKYIHDFKNDYPGAKIFKLDTSYRCTDNIINASGNVIESKKNNLQYLKGIQDDIKISIKEYETEKSEAESIARQIENMMGGLRFFSMDSDITKGYDDETLMFGDFTVLCRFSGQFEYLIKAFDDHSIPCQVIGEEPFYLKSPFSEIIDLLKYIINPGNSFFKYILNGLNLKDDDIKILNKIYTSRGFKALSFKILDELFKDKLNDYLDDTQIFKDIINQYSQNPSDFFKFTGNSKSIDNLNIKGDSVKIMTMHSSKGLEFDTVFIMGCCDRYIPFSLYKNYKVDIEEEKRLLYVAMTRAKKNLFISYPKKIFQFGKLINVMRSPFIEQIKNELYVFKKEILERKDKKDDQLDLF